jgi:hypothetical protein
MVNTVVSVGADNTLPPNVKVADTNLPARLGVSALDAAALRTAPNGALAVTLDRRLITGTVVPALTSGTLRLSAVWLSKGTVVTNLTYLCGTAATSLTNRWFALFDGSRNLLRTTADNTATWNAGSILTLPLSSAYTVAADGLYYVGICEVATTPTAPRGIASTTGAPPPHPPRRRSRRTGTSPSPTSHRC